MCSRYYLDGRAVIEIRKFTEKTGLGAMEIPVPEQRQDIRPSETAFVLVANGSKILCQEKIWGFPRYEEKGLIINARCETALSKSTFAESVLTRRCVIPAAGFYEWNSLKEKASFYSAGSPTLYLAGCYKYFNGADHFVILTAPANESMKGIHDRMPLLLEEEDILPWLTDSARTEEFLLKKPHELKKDMDYEQISFPFLQ